MRGARRRLAAVLALGVCLGAVTSVFGALPETVTGVDLVSTQELPTELIRAALGDLVNRPRSRVAIRQSLDRLWTLGLFSEVRVDEVAGPDGIRLRFHLTRRPQIRRIAWEGNLGLAPVELADARCSVGRGNARGNSSWMGLIVGISRQESVRRLRRLPSTRWDSR